MANEVELTKTEVSMPELVQSFVRAWQSLLNRMPSKAQLAMFLSQNDLETGNRKSMYNNNIGNIIKGNSDFDYYKGRDTQGGKPFIQKFRSYHTLDEGVLDYLKLLYKGYPQSFAAATTGDPIEYSHSLVANPKHSYYDPTVEKQYTAGMTGRYQNYMKSNQFEQAYRNAVGGGADQPPSEMVAARRTTAPEASGLEGILEKYIGMLMAASPDVSLKTIYKEALPTHDILIQIAAPDYTSAIEFSRVLCTALDEDLLATTYPHTDGHLVEVECSIAGPQKECFEAVQQMTQAVAETFKDATVKVGGIVVKNNCIMNKKSSYQPISPQTAGTNYRKFLLKFV